jgi:predicted acyltransferase
LKERFYSLDIFRGATVALMILVNNPGDWDHIYQPLEHAPWNGCTPTDLVFPFFLFAVGNAMAFVFARSGDANDFSFLKKISTRAALIFLIGLFLNWFPFVRWNEGQLVFKHWVSNENPANGVRILGVLQRIALCYFFASLIIHYFKLKGALWISIILLFGYWLLCFLLGSSSDPYSMRGYFGLNVDKTVLGIPHMYKGEGVPFDPEGIASTMPAIVQVVYGYFVGNYILQKGKTYEMLSHLFIVGCLFLFAGYCWNMEFPINKKIWTSSFVVFTSGMATMVLSIFIYLIEFRNMRGSWSRFFNAFGKNPLFVFILSGIIPRLLGLIRWQTGIDEKGVVNYQSPLSWFYEHICAPVSANPKAGSLLFAIITVIFYWLICYWLDRKKIYVKV